MSASGDADADGLPNAWELANGTQPFVSDANDDPDHDGFSNLQECQAGTRPHDPTSLLKLQPNIANAGGITMQFLATSNHSYTVLYKLSLSDATWLKLSDVSPSPADQILNITNSTGTTMGFYRLVTPAQP